MTCSLRIFAGVAISCLAACLPPELPAQVKPPAVVASRAATITSEGASTAPGATANAAANTAPPKPLPAADALFATMLGTIEAHHSIAARVRHRVDMFDHQLVGTGIYLQQSQVPGPSRANGRLLRYEIKIQLDDQVTSLQQISDGNSLWTFQDLLGRQTLSQIDLNRFRRALAAQDKPIKTSPIVAWIALGGLPKMAKGLADWYRFTSVEEGHLDRFPVLILRGQLHDVHLTKLLPGQKDKILAGQPANLDNLAKQIPERVVLMIGRDDLFPYRIEYWRLLPGEKKPLSLKKPPAVDRLLLAMEFFEVQIDVPLDPRQFVYNPGEKPVVDATPLFLQSLELKEVVEIKTPPKKPAGPR